MSRGQVVYTLHLWPPLGHAAHYTGTTPERRLQRRLNDHALGRGARLTQVQVERGGFWVLAQTQPGGRTLERQLKQHGAARRCEVCKAVSGFQAGDLAAGDALGRAGWDRSNPVQRSMLLEIFGLPAPPAALQEPAPAAAAEREPQAWHSYVPAPRPPSEPAPFWPWPGTPALADPALESAVGELEHSWTTPQPDAHPPPEPVLEAGL
jgi:predicted GIY-YIG superfamily endonuclease